MGIRTSDTLTHTCIYIYMSTQVHMFSVPCPWEPWMKLANLSARAAIKDWPDYTLHSSRYHFHRLQHEFHCPPPEVVQCGGPWRKTLLWKPEGAYYRGSKYSIWGESSTGLHRIFFLLGSWIPSSGLRTRTHTCTWCTSWTSPFLFHPGWLSGASLPHLCTTDG